MNCQLLRGGAPPARHPPLSWHPGQRGQGSARRGAPADAAAASRTSALTRLEAMAPPLAPPAVERAIQPQQQHQAGAAPALPAALSPYRVGTFSAQGPRDTMEDVVSIVPDARCGYLYAGVFDGHGGSVSAQWLSAQLHAVVADAVARNAGGRALAHHSPDDGDAPSRHAPQELAHLLVDSFHRADHQLIDHLDAIGGQVAALSGSTATVALVAPHRAIVANVGDSMAVLCRQGAPVPLAVQHRAYGVGRHVSAEVRRVQAAGGWVTDGRVCDVLSVTRAFGDSEFKGPGLRRLMKEGVKQGLWDQAFADRTHFSADLVVATPDVAEIDLTSDDEFLVVASDGLWDAVPPAEVMALVRAQLRSGRLGCDEVAERLTDLALSRFTADNVAVVVVDLKGPSYWAAALASAAASTPASASEPSGSSKTGKGGWPFKLPF